MKTYEAVKKLNAQKPVFSKQLKRMSDMRHSSRIVEFEKDENKIDQHQCRNEFASLHEIGFFVSIFCYALPYENFTFISGMIRYWIGIYLESNIQKCPEIENYASILSTCI